MKVPRLLRRTKPRKHSRWRSLRFSNKYGQVWVMLLDDWVFRDDELSADRGLQ